MFRHLIAGGEITTYILQLLLCLPIVFLSLSLHESAHAAAAFRLGDPTARNLGRISLNPLKHLDPVGFACMLLCGFGWANPVPIYARNFKKPRRDMALSALAGPISNLLRALIFLLLFRFLWFGWLVTLTYTTEFLYNVVYFVGVFLYLGITMNVTLAVFNLLPIPPLDGSRVMYLLLPPKLAYKLARYERQIALVVMLLLLLGPLSIFIDFVTDKILAGMFAMVGMKGFFF